MLPNQYQELSRRTAPVNMSLTNIVMGLVGEGGEIVDLIKKQVFHNHPADTDFKVKLEREIGDYLWYLARLLDYNDADFAPKHMTFDYVQRESSKLVNVTGITNVSIMFGFKNGCIAVNPLNDTAIMYYDIQTLLNIICAIAQHYGVSLEQAAINNIIKLTQRYPQGFSSQDSVARTDTK